MKTTHAIRVSLTGAIGAVLLISAAGCGKKAEQASDTTTAGGAVDTATAAGSVQVADVTLGKRVDSNKRAGDQTDTFKPGDTIYASVHTTGTGSTQLVARWTFQDGQQVDERTETISPTGDAYTEFHIAKPSGFPVGKYTLHVLMDGKEVQTKDFTVQK